jgi:hypothetical protein
VDFGLTEPATALVGGISGQFFSLFLTGVFTKMPDTENMAGNTEKTFSMVISRRRRFGG